MHRLRLSVLFRGTYFKRVIYLFDFKGASIFFCGTHIFSAGSVSLGILKYSGWKEVLHHLLNK